MYFCFMRKYCNYSNGNNSIPPFCNWGKAGKSTGPVHWRQREKLSYWSSFHPRFLHCGPAPCHTTCTAINKHWIKEVFVSQTKVSTNCQFLTSAQGWPVSLSESSSKSKEALLIVTLGRPAAPDYWHPLLPSSGLLLLLSFVKLQLWCASPTSSNYNTTSTGKILCVFYFPTHCY